VPACNTLLTIFEARHKLRVRTIASTKSYSKGSVSMVRKKLGRGRKNRCRFCTKEGCPRPAFVDYKDVQGLKKMCTSQGKLFSRKRSGNCAAFQRAVKDAIKRARFMALMPYVGE
jgi:small subunit ribosomal protein S18